MNGGETTDAKRTGSDFTRLCRANWEILEGRRRLALWCVILLGAAGLSEGSAIMVLLPALKGVTVGQTAIPFWDRAIAVVGLHDGTQAALALFLILGLASTWLGRLSKRVTLRLRVALENDVRANISRSLMHVRWDMFHSLRLGDIGKSVVVEAVQIAACAQMFLQGLGVLLVVLVLMLLALALSLTMTAFTLVFAGLGAVLFRWANRLARKHSDALTDIISDIGIRVSDTFNHLKFLRASGQTHKLDALASQDYANYGTSFFKSQDYGITLRFWQEAAAIFIIWLLLSLGLSTGRIDPLVMMIFLAVFFRMSPRIFALYDYFYQSRAYMNWYWVWKQRFDFARANAVPASGHTEPALTQALRLESLTYAFPGAAAPSLDAVSLTVQRGSCVAIVGPSGCGKSTLGDVILGLLKPTSGTVSLDGKPLWEMDIEHWRKRIGLVLQESPIFHATVLENIAWGDDTPDRRNAELAARQADAWDFIAALPAGLDEMLGEKGARISGGQRQRLALARALYRTPLLLLLDEPTSALDSESEAAVTATLERIKGACTIVIMAHQLRTVRMADRIVVLNSGRIVEQGTWEELIARPESQFVQAAAAQGIAPEA